MNAQNVSIAGQAQPSDDKPLYRVMSMADIQQRSKNGYTVVSTFSGCGGSCLGYRMAGYTVLWANEFIPIAQETYRLNHPDSILDTRDIRQITPQDILQATQKAPGEIDLMEGSPPCASFSTSGKREKGWGEVRKYSETKQRVDDLFYEYIRLVRGLQPRVFVAENVSGLVKGKAKGYFIDILQKMRNAGYRVRARLLDAQWLGVPQKRQRLIFIGVRNDLHIDPIFPKPNPYFYSLRDAFNGQDHVPPIEDAAWYRHYQVGKNWDQCGYGKKHPVAQNMIRPLFHRPCNTITQTTGGRIDHGISANIVSHPTERRSFSIAELKRIMSFPDDFILRGEYDQQYERLGRAVPPRDDVSYRSNNRTGDTG